VVAVPGRFIDIIDWSLPRLSGNHCVVRVNGLRDALQDLLNGPQADGHAKDRGTESLDHTTAVAVYPGTFTHQGTEAGP
jgi:hypothetical protein